ncbi:MAG: hypothetical protein IT530_16075 [Burkholderiales bacterium]|nr:hypothetical protein [Burkholderiales bacterium]
MTMVRYWCFDEHALDHALRDWVAAAAPGEHPEAQAAAESAAATVRSFLTAQEARQHKLLSEIKLAKGRGR